PVSRRGGTPVRRPFPGASSTLLSPSAGRTPITVPAASPWRRRRLVTSALHRPSSCASRPVVTPTSSRSGMSAEEPRRREPRPPFHTAHALFLPPLFLDRSRDRP